MDIDELIKQAEELKLADYNSPRVDLWKKRTKEYVANNYGEDYVSYLRKSWTWNVVPIYGRTAQIHIRAMARAIEFLQTLKNESKKTSQHQQPEAIENNSFPITKLHHLIYEKCNSLFQKEEYAEAVEKGFKIVRNRLRELTGYETGSDAFGKGRLHIKGAAETWVDEDFNTGVKFLTMAIDRFRNEKSHTVDGNINDPQRAYEYLCVSSLAMNLLDKAQILP